MAILDDTTLATLAAICQTSKSPEFFAEVRNVVALAHFRERIRRHAQHFEKIANAAAKLLQHIDALNLDARAMFEEILGAKNDIARGLAALVQLDPAEHTNREYEQQTPLLFAWVKGLSELEGLAHSVAGLSTPYMSAPRRPGPRYIKLGIDGRPISRGRRRGRPRRSAGYGNLEVFIDQLTTIVAQWGGRLMVNDHRHSGTLVAALKLVRRYLPPECRAIPSGSTMRRIKGRSTTHLTPQDLYDVAILAKPKHHKAVAETLRAVGIDLAIVNQYDIACAAEIHAREGAPPGQAFQIAVAHSLMESGYVDRELANKVLGDTAPVKTAELDEPTLATLAAICRPSKLPCDLIKGGPQALGQLDRLIIGPKMHEEQARLFNEHVAMHRGHLDLIFAQRLDDRIDLVSRENKIAGDRGLAATRRLEVN
jgi:hypothetical protein